VLRAVQLQRHKELVIQKLDHAILAAARCDPKLVGIGIEATAGCKPKARMFWLAFRMECFEGKPHKNISREEVGKALDIDNEPLTQCSIGEARRQHLGTVGAMLVWKVSVAQAPTDESSSTAA